MVSTNLMVRSLKYMIVYRMPNVLLMVNGGGIRKSLLYPGKRTWKGYYWYYAD